MNGGLLLYKDLILCLLYVLFGIRDWGFSNYSPLETVKTTVRDRRVSAKKEVVVST